MPAHAAARREAVIGIRRRYSATSKSQCLMAKGSIERCFLLRAGPCRRSTRFDGYSKGLLPRFFLPRRIRTPTHGTSACPVTPYRSRSSGVTRRHQDQQFRVVRAPRRADTTGVVSLGPVPNSAAIAEIALRAGTRRRQRRSAPAPALSAPSSTTLSTTAATSTRTSWPWTVAPTSICNWR